MRHNASKSVSPSAPGCLDIKTICVLGWGLIGDVFVRIPIIEALKRRFPKAHITVVFDPSSREVLANHPDCAELVAYSRKKRPLLVFLRSTIAHIWYLRRRQFDLSIDLYSGGSSPLNILLINARIRLGFDRTWALRKANNVHVRFPSMCGNWAKALGTVLTPLGVSSAEIRRGTSFYCTDNAIEYAARLVGDDSQEYAGFNLGTGAEEKRWPIDRFVELAVRMSRKYHLIPLVFTNPGMEHLASEFVRCYSKHGQVLQAPRESLDRVGALMKRCSYIVTGDTSLMHLAFGLKRPTMVLFIYTRPEVVAPEDCHHTACFIEDPSHVDPCGNPLGTVEIPIDHAQRKFDDLVQLVRSERRASTAEGVGTL